MNFKHHLQVKANRLAKKFVLGNKNVLLRKIIKLYRTHSSG